MTARGKWKGGGGGKDELHYGAAVLSMPLPCTLFRDYVECLRYGWDWVVDDLCGIMSKIGGELRMPVSL